MMHTMDDSRGFTIAEFELTLSHKGSWAETLSKASGKGLLIHPISQHEKNLVVLVFMPNTKAESIDTIKKLRRTGDIRHYEKLQDDVFRVEVDPKKSIIQSIVTNYFEFLSPVTVIDEVEKYRFGTLDISHADSCFSKLIGNLKNMRGVSILDYKSEKVERPPSPERSRLTEEDHNLIRELIASDYFNPKKKSRPRQEDIARKLKLSSGKVNQMLRNLEYMGFQNLLAVKSDLGEFRTILRK